MAKDINSTEECLKAVNILSEELRNAKRSLMNSEQSILDDAHMDHNLVVRFLRERNGDAAYSAMYIHLSHILSAI